ncbi:type VII secretion system-associated protein [Streptomyces polygonati]|uniref:Type VII secretion system-associated protein n=1 Tax=Streptomyces polygonati TaxID=1617087 RepID=A0ABV8HU29_9ACTN
MRDAARLAPDHWLGVVDPAWTADAAPPVWAVVGEWRSGPTGEVEEWQPNEEYRPSPRALGWAAPTDPVDAAVQSAVTGYGPPAAALRALAAAEVTVLRSADGGPLAPAGADGLPVVPVFSAAPHEVFAGGFAHDTVSVLALARDLAASGTPICVNPAGPARLVVTPDEVLAAAAPAGPPAGATSLITDHLNPGTGRTS